MLEANGIEYEYESKRIPYILHKEYVTDFELEKDIIIETKGRFTGEDRTKMRTVLRDNPDLNLFMVFSKPNNTLTKRSKTTYGEWCDKHNIPWMSIEDFEKLVREKKDKYVDQLLERKRKMVLGEISEEEKDEILEAGAKYITMQLGAAVLQRASMEEELLESETLTTAIN